MNSVAFDVFLHSFEMDTNTAYLIKPLVNIKRSLAASLLMQYLLLSYIFIAFVYIFPDLADLMYMQG